MTDISKFFTALSKRAYKENDLSNVTYDMRYHVDKVYDKYGQNLTKAALVLG